MKSRLDRLYDVSSGLLFIAGTLVFLNGGRQHPRIDSSLGLPGSVEYFRNFASHVLHHHDWEGIHAQILAGPVLWALGGVALAERRRRAGESRWSGLGSTALLLGAGCWIVAFIFDGFVAPQIARALAADEGPLSPAYLSEFAANAAMVIRAGLVSWLLIGLSAAAFGASLAVERKAGMLQRVVGWVGIPLGLASIAAWLSGSFIPGPFTSPLWTPIAIATGLWFLLAGIWVMGRDPAAAL
jgi:hypothetical protein